MDLLWIKITGYNDDCAKKYRVPPSGNDGIVLKGSSLRIDSLQSCYNELDFHLNKTKCRTPPLQFPFEIFH